jgi:hypothetical protein
MKLLKDYTDKELIALKDDEKKQLFLLECANRGITLPSATPEYITEPEKRTDLAPDMRVFKISKEYSSDYFYFKDEAKASEVLKLVNDNACNIQYHYRSVGDTLNYEVNQPRKYELKAEMVYSSAKYSQMKMEIDLHEKNKSTIKSNNERRERILREQEEIMTEIDSAIAAADKNVTQLQGFKKLFTQYKEMSNNDDAIAIKFLLNAHYAEISEYGEEQLKEIGISKQDVSKYNSDKPQEEESDI